MVINNFFRDGYVIVPQLFNDDSIDSLRNAIAKYLKAEFSYGIRDIHHKIPEIKNLTTSELIINTLKQDTNEQKFHLIKAIFFNKNINYNWAVGWHQDKTIAVKEKISIYGFKNWTVKKGVPHVQPPLNILDKITTIRIALNDTNSNNGALKFIPQSHKLGVLTQSEINRIANQREAGDVLMGASFDIAFFK